MIIADVEGRAKGFFSEFWKFAAKGNVAQLAVAVILGNAFGAIVNSLVGDVVLPLLSLATNNINFANWQYVIRPPVVLGGATTPEVVVNYGHVLQTGANFMVIALCIFVVFKLLTRVGRRFLQEEQDAPPVPVSTQEKLLGEIRDLLKEKQTKESQGEVRQ